MTLLATGSEVEIAVAAADMLRQQNGIDAAVVSMPCWELFEEQDAAYRAQVLGLRAAGRRRSGGSPRLGPLDRRGRRLRRHDRLRRLRAGRGPLPAFRHHAGGGRRRNVAAARPIEPQTEED